MGIKISNKKLNDWLKIEPQSFILASFDPNSRSATQLARDLELINGIKKVKVLSDKDGIEIVLNGPDKIEILDIIRKEGKIGEYNIIAKYNAN